MSKLLGCVLLRLLSWSNAVSNRAEHRSPAIGTFVSGGRPPEPKSDTGLLSKRLTSNRGRRRDSEI